MSDQQNRGASKLTCAECCQRLLAYQDDSLTRTDSMQVFLHLRTCVDCTAKLDHNKRLVALLESLPQRQPPAGFDARVLASVPYDAYRAMADLRRPRVPVFLSEEALPGWIRARGIRWTGAAMAVVALAGYGTGFLPGEAMIAGLAGLIPEMVLRLQGFGRRLALAANHARRSG